MAETVNPINPMKTVVCNTIRDLFKVDSGHSLYLVLSHPTPGPTGDYDASRYSDIETWKHGIVAKRILDLNVHLMAAKNEWKYETIYMKYTDSMSSIGDAIDTTDLSVSAPQQLSVAIHFCSIDRPDGSGLVEHSHLTEPEAVDRHVPADRDQRKQMARWARHGVCERCC